MEVIEKIFGVGKELSVHQMCARAFITFFITLALIRLAGMRSIGKKSAFDTVIAIMLGAVLGRVIVGASAFFPTVAGGIVIVLVHRIVAVIALKHEGFAKIVKGEHRQLYANGHINSQNMKRSCISESDLLESIRLQANVKTLSEIEEAYMENNGEISVIKKKGI
jgi:uncharacterized membrane protein YcaP (DUF421 family)